MIGKRIISSIVLTTGFFTLGAYAESLTMATWGGGVETVWEEAFAKPFEASTGIHVKVVPVPNPEAQLRNPAAKAQYDVALVTYPQGANLLKDGLIRTFGQDELPATEETNQKYLMKDVDGKLAGASPYFMFYGIAINNKQAARDDFKSWADLSDPKWKDKLALTRPVYLSTYDLPILSIAQGGSETDIDPGAQLLRKIAPNALTLYTSIAHLNGLITRGEIAVAPYYSGRVWQMRREGATDVDMVIPEEGALMIPYIVVVPKEAKKIEALNKWLDFISTAQPQVKALEMGGYFPLNKNAELPPEMQEEMGYSMAQLFTKLHQPDWAVISMKQQERTDLAEKIIAESR